MAFWKRKKREQPERSNPDVEDYEQAAADRVRSIGESGGYSFSADEREDVEARIRRMWYGAKKEGGEAQTEEDD